MSEKITCFNRDKGGKCLAYNDGHCYLGCPARLSTPEQKISLLQCLLAQSQSKKDKKRLTEELEDAKVVKAAILEGKFEGWMGCYFSDLHRGEKGGASESDSNRSTGMKQLMKDNRPVGVKPTKAQQEEYKQALKNFEESVGEKMEKLGRTGLSHSKIDSYTQVPICFLDEGGYCKGQLTGGGNLDKECKSCLYLKENLQDSIHKD